MVPVTNHFQLCGGAVWTGEFGCVSGIGHAVGHVQHLEMSIFAGSVCAAAIKLKHRCRGVDDMNWHQRGVMAFGLDAHIVAAIFSEVGLTDGNADAAVAVFGISKIVVEGVFVLIERDQLHGAAGVFRDSCKPGAVGVGFL